MGVCGFIPLKAGTPVTIVHQAQAWLGDEGGATQGWGKTSWVAVEKHQNPQKVCQNIFLLVNHQKLSRNYMKFTISPGLPGGAGFSFAAFFDGAFTTLSTGTPKHPEADISFLFDFAASRGLSKEWNFVAESFLAPEGGQRGLEELTNMWYERWEKKMVISWFEKETAIISDDFFPESLLLGHSTKIIGSLFQRGL